MNWLNKGTPAWRLAGATMALLAGLVDTAQTQETALVKRITQLRDAPAETGASVAPLEANTVVTRTSERKGAWTKVEHITGRHRVGPPV